jgi:FAD/FMN-containing dehydrogenase
LSDGWISTPALVRLRDVLRPAPVRPPSFRGIFRDDLPARAVYAESAGIARCVPRAVAVPADAEDVIALVVWAATAGVPLIPRGSGSSMAGGAVGDGVIVDLGGFREMGPIDIGGRRVRAGAGVLCQALDRAARAAGLRFPVDPSSAAFCTIGGMASTNAAGARTLKYGAARGWITGLDCVFDDGSRATLRRGEAPPDVPAIARFLRDVGRELRSKGATMVRPGVRKESSGYGVGHYARTGDVLDLVVGSEGTLAIIVGVEAALTPTPEATASVLASFRSLDAAVAGARLALEAGASACELLDRTFLDVAREGGSVPVHADTEAVLMIELEAQTALTAETAARMLADVLRASGAVDVALGLSPEDEKALWALRHAASPILATLDPSLASMQVIEDGAVPPDRLADYVRGVRAILAANATRGVIFGHAGDAHVHANVLIDLRREDWRRRVEDILAGVVALTTRLGGTLSGEHGDGRLRAPLLDESWGRDATAVFARVKHAFDPAGILNPGVKVPLPGQRAIDIVKYDPALPPLPPSAERVLDRVVRRRDYARSRLEMLAEPD